MFSSISRIKNIRGYYFSFVCERRHSALDIFLQESGKTWHDILEEDDSELNQKTQDEYVLLLWCYSNLNYVCIPTFWQHAHLKQNCNAGGVRRDLFEGDERLQMNHEINLT